MLKWLPSRKIQHLEEENHNLRDKVAFLESHLIAETDRLKLYKQKVIELGKELDALRDTPPIVRREFVDL